MSFLILSIFISVSSFVSDLQKGNTLPWARLEDRIRKENDSRANFTWDQYAKLLTVLSDKKFIVLPLNEMRNTFDSSRVVVGMRHDIDKHPFKALEMADMEKKFGIRATYYVLPTAEYYGTIRNTCVDRNPEMGALYQELYKKGAEIGIHNDLITMMIQDNCDPLPTNREVLDYFLYLGIPIYGTASHGSELTRSMGINNFMIFSDFAISDTISHNGHIYRVGQYSLKQYGYKYEAYHIKYNIYLSESGGAWKDAKGLDGILEQLRSAKPGDRIEILTHPDWWGKKNETK
jgi:hypothetical protein